jgi:predicted MFS family arabinose efflux permease
VVVSSNQYKRFAIRKFCASYRWNRDVTGMRFFGFDRKVITALFALSIAQIIGWGTVGLPAIVGRQIAADLRMDISSAFAGTSILYVVMGLCASVLAEAFIRFGARQLMMIGTMIAAAGFALLSFSHHPVSYYAAWLLLGTAGSATLSTAAYIMLNEIAGRNAKSAIGALMLATGLSSSIFWPITSFLSNAIGWRGTCLVYAAMMVLVCLPLYAFGLPRRVATANEANAGIPSTSVAPIVQKGTFYLVVSAIALNAFVTLGFSAVLVELLKAEGLSPAEAVGFGSVLGVIQVSARAMDFFGGGRWDGITTGQFAGIALPVAMLLLMIGNGSPWAVAAFMLIYGLGSGALAVARVTIPLVFYDKAEFARATSRIALPLNLISAIAPPILVGLLAHFGANTLLGVAMLCSSIAFSILLLLGRRRPTAGKIPVTA